MSQRWPLLAAFAALALLAALVLFLRLPGLPQSVIDWDESNYLLMACSMLQGHAPYTVIWGNKLPGLYVLFALAQIVFGPMVLAPMIGVDPLAALERIMALWPRNVALLENYQRDPNVSGPPACAPGRRLPAGALDPG